MKRNLIALCLAVCLLSALLVLPTNALSTKKQNWFFKPNGEQQPELLGGSPLLSQYDVLALGDPNDKVVYLTFDAGYENGNVAKVLDALQKHNAPAAFFVLPGLLKHNPEVVTRMVNEGHTVCNHSTSHRDMSGVTDLDAFRAELQGIEDAYKTLTGLEMPKYFRPPEGSFSEQTLAFCDQLGYKTVFWSFAYADWDNNKQPGADFAKNKILSNLHPGEVLLLHPTSATNAAILDELLTEMESRGYRFGTLDELSEVTKTRNERSAETVNIEQYKQQGLVFAGNREAGKVIALTFDDGPHPTQTDEILAVLKKYGVRATFFPIGENVQAHPEVEKRVCDAGHEIGNHTFSHATVSRLTDEKLKEEIQSTASILQEQVGCTPVVFRPPGGDISDAAVHLVNELGYRYVLWSWRVDTRDWAAVSVQSVIQTVVSNVQDGDIVLFHDYVVGNSPTAKALDILIPRLQQMGYRFVTVSELAAL